MNRVRFAPSPTGNLHVGNARTAVLNHLFARHGSSQFILRIEDTDVERSQSSFEESIKEDLRWLSLDWDEGPYRQSDRLDIYRSEATALLEKGLAYKCFCSKEELDLARADAVRRGQPPRYARVCAGLSPDAVRRFEAAGTPYVIRFRSMQKEIRFHDAIYGDVSFPADHVDDFIIVRTDGMPAYNFAASVDDRLMKITHVIRGSDHLSNTPKQIMLFLAFGVAPPAYAHHSLLIGVDRKPLSKRHGATRVAEFRDLGILPEAMVNYLAIVGRKVDREFISPEGLAEAFTLGSFSSADAVFDPGKLLWLNKEYLRTIDAGALLERMGLDAKEDKERILLIRENASTLEEMRSMLRMFREGDVDAEAFDFLASIKDRGEVEALMLEAAAADHGDLERLLKSAEERSTLSRRELFMALRVIITGRKSGPPLKELYRLMPKDTILERSKCLGKRFSAAPAS
ncbi:MAG TPA: glutamate--tRNA ligase [Syntrophorhabdales bacterium]|nr:glutamate--tRNA ligase [Syntrophorhabdales bacterium]